MSNILIWVSLDFSQPGALEIQYVEQKMMTFEKEILTLIDMKYFLF